MTNQTLRFKIITEYMKNPNIYAIGKKLKKPTSQIAYYVNELKNVNLPSFVNPTFLRSMGENMVPLFSDKFAELTSSQIKYILHLLFYFIMNDFEEE